MLRARAGRAGILRCCSPMARHAGRAGRAVAATSQARELYGRLAKRLFSGAKAGVRRIAQNAALRGRPCAIRARAGPAARGARCPPMRRAPAGLRRRRGGRAVRQCGARRPASGGGAGGALSANAVARPRRRRGGRAVRQCGGAPAAAARGRPGRGSGRRARGGGAAGPERAPPAPAGYWSYSAIHASITDCGRGLAGARSGGAPYRTSIRTSSLPRRSPMSPASWCSPRLSSIGSRTTAAFPRPCPAQRVSGPPRHRIQHGGQPFPAAADEHGSDGQISRRGDVARGMADHDLGYVVVGPAQAARRGRLPRASRIRSCRAAGIGPRIAGPAPGRIGGPPVGRRLLGVRRGCGDRQRGRQEDQRGPPAQAHRAHAPARREKDPGRLSRPPPPAAPRLRSPFQCRVVVRVVGRRRRPRRRPGSALPPLLPVPPGPPARSAPMRARC